MHILDIHIYYKKVNVIDSDIWREENDKPRHEDWEGTLLGKSRVREVLPEGMTAEVLRHGRA